MITTFHYIIIINIIQNYCMKIFWSNNTVADTVSELYIFNISVVIARNKSKTLNSKKFWSTFEACSSKVQKILLRLMD